MMEKQVLDETQNDHTQITAADEANSFAEYAAVKAVLEIYLDAARLGDGALSRTAFYDHAHVVGSIAGQTYEMDADTFAGAVTEGGAATNIQHHIAWINISGPAAAARIEIQDWSGMRYTDFFVLYKKDGTWKISSKVFDSHTKN